MWARSSVARLLLAGAVLFLAAGSGSGCGGGGKKPPVSVARPDGGDGGAASGDGSADGPAGEGGVAMSISDECARQACNPSVSDLCCPSSCSAATDIDCGGCGNGRLEAGELCDPPGSCPQSCPQLRCEQQRLKSEGTCAAVCVPAGTQTSCMDGDECCPAGCTAVNDRDCSSQCGNGVTEPGELCDPLTTCPQSCPMQGCTLLSLVGAGTCLARCMESGQETQCRANDGCCPSGCTAANDSDCAVVCGNGTIEGRETCDPLASCPTACPAMGCRLRRLVNGGTCTAACIDDGLQTQCRSGDGCCPVGCLSTNDNDCPALCGNSVVEAGETCDPIATCLDRERACVSDATTVRTRSGDAGRCQFTCTEATRTCGPADGACPPGCGPTLDRDCPGCGNGVMEPNETCDPPTACQERQQACVSDQSTVRTPGGDAAACTFTCTETPRACGPADGNCPSGCTADRDPDCVGCGNGVLDPGETCDPVAVCNQRAEACVSDANTVRTPEGDPNTCRFTCRETTRMCGPVDRFCPSTCGPTTDRDCPGCGNGRVESGETCDPCAPEDVRACVGDVNTIRTPSGSAEACTFACTTMPRPCQSGDGFCPAMCTRATDGDCREGPGGACDSDAHCGAGSCVDGRCCVQTCAVCQECTGPNGTCANIPAGQPDNVPAGACGGEARCNGQGSCQTPMCELTITPPREDFGAVRVGASSRSHSFTIASSCPRTVGITSSNPNEFVIGPNVCSNVGPGMSCQVGVTFRPGAAGARSGVLVVTPNSGPAVTAALMGTGQAATLVFRPAGAAFGRVAVGEATRQTLMLFNEGTANSGEIGFTVGEPFSVAASDCKELGPGQSCQVTVAFRPERPGEYNESLVARGALGGSDSARLTGAGIERPVQPLTITPSSHGFGTILVGGRSPPATFTVIAGIELDILRVGTTSSEFEVTEDRCTRTRLAAGGQCTVTVVFAPTVAGQKDGVFLQAAGRETVIVRQPMTYTASSSLTGAGRPRVIAQPPGEPPVVAQ